MKKLIITALAVVSFILEATVPGGGVSRRRPFLGTTVEREFSREYGEDFNGVGNCRVDREFISSCESPVHQPHLDVAGDDASPGNAD